MNDFKSGTECPSIGDIGVYLARKQLGYPTDESTDRHMENCPTCSSYMTKERTFSDILDSIPEKYKEDIRKTHTNCPFLGEYEKEIDPTSGIDVSRAITEVTEHSRTCPVYKKFFE